ncbi:uncharacterized protein LOC121905790 [Thunnus maccoyii]|uniref:uncharacterized protein LOC121905790 n=1 Tax=Thunnus maccoyii TaxID=8240 RepID=UPI001C4D0B95|nr:uncharacterized protein LOC121905790 [Thunnus maccoyii]
MGCTKTQDYQFFCSELYIRRCLPLLQQASTVSLKKGEVAFLYCIQSPSLQHISGKMRNLIFVVMILQLTVTIIGINGELKFGDIIAFPRKFCGKTFKHYAIYVGENFDKKDPKHNIFHRNGPVIRLLPKPSLSDCIFDTLDINKEHYEDNYFDKLEEADRPPGLKVGTPEEIAARIQEKHGKCGTYGPRGNNCEHLATYVRYGVKISLQLGTDAESYCKNDDSLNTDKIKKIIRELNDFDEQYECPSNSASNRGPG